MLINYSLANALHLPVTNKEGVICNNLLLSPGVNSVDDDDWDTIKEHPKVKKMIATNILVVEAERSGSRNEDGEISEIRSMNLKKAIPLIKKTYDVILLETWLHGEDRPGVAKEIEKQIEMVESLEIKKEA